MLSRKLCPLVGPGPFLSARTACSHKHHTTAAPAAAGATQQQRTSGRGTPKRNKRAGQQRRYGRTEQQGTTGRMPLSTRQKGAIHPVMRSCGRRRSTTADSRRLSFYLHVEQAEGGCPTAADGRHQATPQPGQSTMPRMHDEQRQQQRRRRHKHGATKDARSRTACEAPSAALRTTSEAARPK